MTFTLTSYVDLGVLARGFAPPNAIPLRVRVENGLSFGGSTNPGATTTEAPTTGNGILVWSAEQDAQSTTLEGMGVTINWPDDPNNEYAEAVRETHTDRIEQDGNPDNYVDVEVIDSIQFKNKKQQPSFYTLDNP